MRLSLLLLLAVCALFTEQAAAQSAFRTAWGRHLGWGVGPGYHSYSQFGISPCDALGHQHEMPCTTCPSSPAQKVTMFYGNGGGSVLSAGQPAISHQHYPTMTPRVPAYFVPVGPQLAPQQPHLAPTAPPASVAPAPLASAPTAYRIPSYQPQYGGMQRAAATPPHLVNPFVAPPGMTHFLWPRWLVTDDQSSGQSAVVRDF